MFARFTPEARRTTVRAGLLSLDHGRTALDEDMFLLALAESWPVADLAVTPEAVGAEIRNREAAKGRAGDRALLAAIGIDLDEIRRRLPARRDDPPGVAADALPTPPAERHAQRPGRRTCPSPRGRGRSSRSPSAPATTSG
ncbi:hypothetical protein [Streptosporangium vulgare]|uniref:hypothetical protein n=1 Tax=Streptosporangium vulgare TaxID=46190 RepID=UPI0031D52BB6